MTSAVARLQKVADATSEPVSLSDFKVYAKIDSSSEDNYLTALLKSARMRVEKDTGLALMTQTWTATFDRWPQPVSQSSIENEWWDGVKEGVIAQPYRGAVIEINKAPFQSVDNIKLRSYDGSITTVDVSVYSVQIANNFGRIVRNYGQVWPAVILAPVGGLVIQFKVGYDVALYEGEVPSDLATCIMMLASYWHETRESVIEGRFGSAPDHLRSILNSYQSLRLR